PDSLSLHDALPISGDEYICPRCLVSDAAIGVIEHFRGGAKKLSAVGKLRCAIRFSPGSRGFLETAGNVWKSNVIAADGNGHQICIFGERIYLRRNETFIVGAHRSNVMGDSACARGIHEFFNAIITCKHRRIIITGAETLGGASYLCV